MALIKKALLLSVAATALAAMAATSSASATVLCKTNPVGNVCPAGAAYQVGEEIRSEGTQFKFKAGFAVYECEHFAFSGVIQAAPENPAVVLKGTKFEPTLCKAGQEFKLVERGEMDINSVPGTANGKLTWRNLWEIKTGSIACRYGYTIAGSSATVYGGSPARYEAAEVGLAKQEGGILCANPAHLSFSTAVSNSPLYVAQS